jgi:prevent-host-death family protein
MVRDGWDMRCSTRRYGRSVAEIAQRELRNDNAEVIRRVEAGETFVVTRNGVPVAELRPLPAGRQRVVHRDRLAEVAAGPLVTEDDAERARCQRHLQEVEALDDPIPVDAAAARGDLAGLDGLVEVHPV